MKNHRLFERKKDSPMAFVQSKKCKPTIGDRAFHAAAPKLWKDHPEDIGNKDHSIIGSKSALN